jgi:hypothetical protein
MFRILKRVTEGHVSSTWCRWVLFFVACIPVHGLSAEIDSGSGGDEKTLDREVRTALAGAVEFFQKRATEDEEGWVVPPTRTRKVVDHEIVVLRYREVIREVPVYKYKYETYEVVEKVRVGESAAAVNTFRKVKKRRVVSRKQVGVKKVKGLVRDPNGSIERKHRKAKYGPGGPDVWARYSLGDNALALYALRRSGVSASDSTVNQLASNLKIFLTKYGYPDETWDLAWLTAAFSSLPFESNRKTARTLASKLLDGQIRDGDAAGLWGPVSINTSLLAEQTLKVEGLTEKFQEAKKNSKKGKRELRAFQKIDKTYRDALANLERVATFGMTGNTIETGLLIKSEFGPSVKLPGLCDYIYNQRTADLGSTALALYALRQAAENGTFPKKLWRPESSKVDAESPSRLLSASMKALAKKLEKKRGWDEMNIYQPVNDFDKIGIFPGVPGADVSFPKPASGTNLLTTMQGFSAMAGAAHIAKSDTLNTKYRKHLVKGSELFRASAESLLKGGYSKESKPWQLAPYDHYLFLSEVTRGPNSTKEDRRDLWEPLASHLLSMRSAKGSWEDKKSARHFHFPTSLMARLAVMEEPKKKKKVRVEYDQPHVYRGYRSIAALLRSGRKLPVKVEDVVPTSLAMVFLAENVRPPVIGECLWTEDAKGSRLTPLVTSVMRQQKGMPFRYSAVSRPLQTKLITELPVLLIRGKGTFDPDDQESKALQDYLNAGGLVLFEAMADSDGAKFLSGAKRVLKTLLPESSTLEDVGSDKNLMGSAVGKASIQAFKLSNGSLAAAFLPLAPKDGAKGLPRSTAARAVYNMLFQKITPEMLEENYPISGSPPVTAPTAP